ncbi:MAG: hypothetical protein VR69_16080 [Peptococcaceae bacterium BRH_c4b]|nr:MAG: hypothetical protein VR69_16080 [Peptococcaceae bacterium BRH_c4b]
MNNSEQLRAIEFENIELTTIIQRLENGQYAIPVFQRDFVWDKSNIRDLWDSIYRHYPIGSFLIWETDEQLPRHRNILNIELKENSKGKFNYVLDGQQRITSIIGAVKGAKRNRTSFKLFFNISKAYEMSKKDLLDQISNSPFLTEKELKDSSSSDQVLPLEKLLDFDSAIYRNLSQINYDLSDYYLTISEKFRKDYKVSV